MSVNKAKVREWVKALRSGEYKQGRNHLRLGDRFCCLGVLCEVIGIESMLYEDPIYLYDNECYFLPKQARVLLNNDSNKVELTIRDRNEQVLDLVQLNDNGFTFDQIADVIEWEFLN